MHLVGFITAITGLMISYISLAGDQIGAVVLREDDSAGVVLGGDGVVDVVLEGDDGDGDVLGEDDIAGVELGGDDEVGLKFG